MVLSAIPEDHPSGCGEHIRPVWDWIVDKGSSPRMRGARFAILPIANKPRIIPADAGSTG